MAIEWKGSQERGLAVIGVALVHVLIGYALLTGLSNRIATPPEEVLKLFTVTPSPPPSPEPKPTRPATRSAPKREGAASPRNLKSRATEVVALPAPIVIPPPTVIAAPTPGLGDDRSSGASTLPGPGTGSGGQGTGTGSGAYGDGPGGGGGTGPRQIAGRIRNSDYPRGAVEAGQSGIVSVRYTVAIDGRVSRCIVTRSSGSIDLDQTTCRLIQQRFRFKPAKDASGRTVQADIVEDHEWIMEHDLAPDREQ